MKVILGAGITGLAAGFNTDVDIYEAKDIAGGICRSYYVSSATNKISSFSTSDVYRFEIGGGHWIFGADNEILNFINSLSDTKSYRRKSAVYFPDMDLYVPYPLQNHLFYLPQEIRNKALNEILNSKEKETNTLAEWLELSFGRTLCELFFFPFHELYTAGLYKEIAPQDKFKTPVNKELILKGAKEETPEVGYNTVFVYPEKGLDDLVRKMAERCKINYNKEVVKIDIKKKEIFFTNGSSLKYEKIISTISLNKVIQMTGIQTDELPYTSTLVVNIGAKRGEKCPDEHWIYIPQSKTGFHRVGFYSNVDDSFLPLSSRKNNIKVSIYVEKAYLGGDKLSEKEIRRVCEDIVKELQSWRFITEVEVIHPTWIDIAYTWEYSNSTVKKNTLEILRRYDIFQTGRYGKWQFQGIAQSLEAGIIARRNLL